MYAEEQTDLKKRMKHAGITLKAVSQRLRKPYSTIGGQLGGFTPLDDTVKETIEKMINETKIETSTARTVEVSNNN
jgi:hypothetical protein